MSTRITHYTINITQSILLVIALFVAPVSAAQYNCTWNTGSGTWETAGNWSNCNSTYPNNGADTYTATIDNSSAAVTTGSTAVTIDALTVGGTNTSTLTLSFNLTVTGDVAVNSNGTLDGTTNVTVNGGDVTGSGAISMTGGTFLVDGQGDFGGSTGWSFNNLTFGNGSGATTTTAAGSGDITVSGTLSIAASQTLDAGTKTWILSGSGTPLSVSGTLTPNASTFRYTYNGGSATNVAAANYYDLEFAPGSSSQTYALLGGNWWNENWTRRKDITIDNSGNPETLANYQTKVSVTYDSDMQADFDDIRFTTSSHIPLDYWLETKVDSTSATFWVEVDSIPGSGSKTIYMYYGNANATSAGSLESTFRNGQVYLETRRCTNATNCGYTNNHTEFDSIVSSGYTKDGSSYRDAVNDPANPFGSSDRYFSRYRLLFKADTTGTHYFGVNSNDAGEVHMRNAGDTDTSHTVLAYWYGAHYSGTCGTDGYLGSQSLNSGDVIWLEFRMTEWDDLNFASMCIQETSGSYQTVTAANFPGQLFSRTITDPEPSVNTGSESSLSNNPLRVHDLTLTGAGDATVDADTNDPYLDINGTLTINSGDTFEASSASVCTVAGGLTNSGTFNHNDGTVIFDTSGTATISGSTTFYNLTSGAAGKALQFDDNDSMTFTVGSGGTLAIAGTLADPIAINSDSAGNQWTIDHQGSEAVTYASIKDSGCAGGSTTITASDGSSVHLGNNGSCWSLPALSTLDESDGRLFYGTTGFPAESPRSRTWDNSGSSWSSATGVYPINATRTRWVVNKIAPSATEELAAVLSDAVSGTRLEMLRWEGTRWISDWSSTAITSANALRRGFDLEYETPSGDALVVYSNNTANPQYRTRSSGSWGSASNVFGSAPGSGVVQWAELVALPGSNEIALVYSDANSDLFAAIWDGTQWVSASTTTLETDLRTIDHQNFAAAYELKSGDLLVVWGRVGLGGFAYVTKAFGSDTFSSVNTNTDLDDITTLSLASEPGGGRIAMAMYEYYAATTDNDLGVGMWDGNQWLNLAWLDDYTVERISYIGVTPIAVAWAGVTGTAVAVYADDTGTALDWAKWTPSTGWVLQSDYSPTPAMGTEMNIQGYTYGSQNKALFLIVDSNNDLWAKTYDGANWSDIEGGSALETNVSAVNGMPFSVALKSSTMSVAGYAYEEEGSTVWSGCDDSSNRVSLRVLGIKYGPVSCSSSDGAFSFSNVTKPVGGAPVVAWFDGVSSNFGNTVSRYSGSGNVSGLNLRRNRLIVMHDDSGPITNADLSAGDNDSDSDMGFDVDGSGNLTMEDGIKLIVNSSDTFTPGGTVTTSPAGSSSSTDGDLLIQSGATLSMGVYDLFVGGDLANSGTFSKSTGQITTFTATGNGFGLSGTLNGTSSFERAVFDGSGGGWTIKDSMRVAMTNVDDTLIIRSGTLTLGDGDGDSLEVLGRFNIATTANETAIFQTATIPQGQLVILDMNQNSSPLYCPQCIIDVGAPSGTGQGTFRLRKNSVLRLNPRNVTGTETDTTIYVRSTGYLDIQGERWPAAGDFTDTGTDASPIDKRETKLCANATFSSGEHNSKVARMMTGLAVGKLYDISATTVDDSDCATDSHDSVTVNDASNPTGTGFANMLVSGSGPTRRLCSDSTSLITADNQEIGRYIRDLTGSTGYVKIVDSANDDAANCSGNDGFTVIAEPDAFTILSDNDDFKITDGIRPDDTFEVFDYAHVTAENGTACDVSLPRSSWSFIECNAGSEALIQYADICDEYGVFFNGVNGANSNEGVTVNKSRLRNKYMSIVFDAAANNTGGKGITNNSVSGLGTGMTFWSSNNNYVASNAIFSNTGQGIYVETSDNNTYSSNIIYNNGDWGIRIYTNGSDGNAVSSNVMYNNGGGIMIGSGNTNNAFSSNTAFGNLDAGIGSEAAANTYSSNTLYANQYDNLYLDNAHNSIVTSNICYSNVTSGQGISVNNTRNAILASNQTYNGLDNGILINDSPNNTLLSNQSHDNPQTGIYLVYTSSGTILGLNQVYANGAAGIGIAVDTATTTKLFSNSVYSNAGVGLYVSAAPAMTVVSVNDDFGSSGANIIADIGLADNAADKLRLYDTTLASSTEAQGVSVNNAYIISRMHDGAAGVTKIWGDYNTVTANVETPQAEETGKFNYADNLWDDSFTAHYYSVGQGAGTEDTDLQFAFSGGAMGGDAVAYAYKVLCTKSNCVTSPADAWDVYRNGTLLTLKATTNQQYTDTQDDGVSAPGVQFKIEDAGTDYTAGAAYTFVAYKKSGDTTTQKTVTLQQNGDSFIVTAATSAEFTGQSGSLSTMTGSTGTTYVLTLSGNISGSYNDITVTGATTVNSAATLSGGTGSTFTANAGVTGAGTITYGSGSTFTQRVAAAVNFGTSSGNTWTFNDLKFENSSGTNRTVTIVAGTGPTVVNGTLTIGNPSDTNTTALQANTNDRILDINGNLAIASMGRLQASNSASLTIGGNFTRDGTLTHNSGTITFDDNTKTSTLLSSGTTTFYNLNILTGGKQMKFDNADQTNIAGTLTVQGSDCTAGRVLLDSDVNDSIWELNVTGSASISYADIEDCSAIVALTANNSTQDNDNNTSWTINGCGAFTPRCSGTSGYPSTY